MSITCRLFTVIGEQTLQDFFDADTFHEFLGVEAIDVRVDLISDEPIAGKFPCEETKVPALSKFDMSLKHRILRVCAWNTEPAMFKEVLKYAWLICFWINRW